jgi:hypothetical protein
MERFRYDRSSKWLIAVWYNDSFSRRQHAMIDSPYLISIIEEQGALRFAREMEQLEKLPSNLSITEKFVIHEVAKVARKGICRILRLRFGSVPTEVVCGLERVIYRTDLNALADWAETCSDFDAFRQRLPK